MGRVHSAAFHMLERKNDQVRGQPGALTASISKDSLMPGETHVAQVERAASTVTLGHQANPAPGVRGTSRGVTGQEACRKARESRQKAY